MIMAKKDSETKVEEVKNNDAVEEPEITPEELLELLSNVNGGNSNMQTIMSIGLAEKLYLEDLGDRLFYLDSEVNSDLLHTVTMQIYKINGCDYGIPVDERTPIVLVINCVGGSVFDGMGLIDAIRQSNTPVIGVCTGYAMSMAFTIFSVCHTRISMPNAIFMYHDGEEGVYNTVTKFADWATFYPKVDKRLRRMIAERSKFTVEYLEQIAPHDNFWFADEMVEKGIVDGIIGVDIEMEDIFSFMSVNDNIDDKCDCNKEKDK